MSEIDSGGCFAPDYMSCMSESISWRQKSNSLMLLCNILGALKRRAPQFEAGLSEFRCMSSVLTLLLNLVFKAIPLDIVFFCFLKGIPLDLGLFSTFSRKIDLPKVSEKWMGAFLFPLISV